MACDKTIPGAAMALLRLNLPGVILYGGSILPGHHKAATSRCRMCLKPSAPMRPGKMSDEELLEIENQRLPGRGSVRGPVHCQHHGDGDGAYRSVAHGHRLSPSGGCPQRRRGATLRRGDHELRAEKYPSA